MQPSQPKLIRFGVFEVDLAARELRKRGKRVHLQDQPFRVLEALLEKPNEIVTREELKDRLWSQDEFVEFDKSLNTAVQRIREALGDSASSPRFVETIPRQGYKFIAPIEAPRAVVTDPDAMPEPRSRRWLSAAGVAVVALAMIGLAVWYWTSAPQEQPPPGQLTKFTLRPEMPPNAVGIWAVQPSPDGHFVAFQRGTMEEGRDLVLCDARQDTFRELASAPNGRLFWSPDSRQLGVINTASLDVVDWQNDAIRTLASWPERPGWFARGAAWSPDGETIVFSAGPGFADLRLYRIPASGGSFEPVFEPAEDDPSASLGFFDPSYVPAYRDRQALLYAQGVPFAADIAAINLETGDRRTIVSGAGAFGRPAYAPSGHIVYEESEARIWALPFSLEELAPTGDPFVIAESARTPGVSRDGTLAYVKVPPGASMQLKWRDRTGRVVGAIGEPLEQIAMPVLSPNEKEVVTLGWRGGMPDIWVHEVERPVSRRLTFDAANNDRPSWRPSGKEITFSAALAGPSDIWMAAADGGDEPALLASSPGPDNGYEWTPDGKFLVGSGGNVLFYLREQAGGGGWEKVIIEDNTFDHVGPDLSPDGRYVAYASNESGRLEVWVRPFPEGDGKWRVSTNGGHQPRWQSSGEIFYVQGDSLMAVPVRTEPEFSAGNPERLFDGDGIFQGRGQRYDVTKDGQRFVVAEGVGARDAQEIQVVLNWYEEFRQRN